MGQHESIFDTIDLENQYDVNIMWQNLAASKRENPTLKNLVILEREK